MELADEIADEYLTCTICLDTFEDPKQLPCLHSFCRKCLRDHIVNNVPRGKTLTFTCPICRKVTKPADPDASKLKEWADDFPNNFFILGLMETLNTRSSRSACNNLRKSLTAVTENCSKHIENTCNAYCTLKRIAVCGECCLEEHKDCGTHHLNTDEAADVTAVKLHNFKSKMETFREDVEAVREKLELSLPRQLRLQKEELALKISEHFSELKSKIVKCLIKKENDVAMQLADVIEEERKGISDSVNDCSSIIKSFNGTVDLFDKLMTGSPICALTALYNMEEQIASYTTAVETLQSHVEKCPVEFIPIISEIEEVMKGVKIGEIKRRQESMAVHVIEAEDVAEVEALESITMQEDDSVTDDDDDDRTEASAPPPEPVELPYSLQGFSSISLQPRPGERSIRYDQESQRSSSYNAPTSPSFLTSLSTRVLQSRPANDYNVTLWRTVAFFGNVTYSERRGGFVGITATSRNICAVADRFNNTVKIINIKGKIVNAISFGNMDPWDLTYDKSLKQLVVTCPNQSVLTFVSEDADNSGYCISHTTQTQPYSSIATLRPSTYVVGLCRPRGSARVDVINSYGEILSYVDVSVQYPRVVEATGSGKLVICDWTKNEVVFVGQSGVVEQTYHGVSNAILKEPMGMTKDAAGNIYVLDHKRRKVHILNGQTGACRTVVPLEGVQDPKMICMVDSTRTEQSLVVLDSQNGVHIFGVDIPPGDTQV